MFGKETKKIMSTIKKNPRKAFKVTGKKIPSDIINAQLGIQNMRPAKLIQLTGGTNNDHPFISGTKEIKRRDQFLKYLIALSNDTDEINIHLKECGFPVLYAKDARDQVIMRAVNQGFNYEKTNKLLASEKQIQLQ